MDINALIRTLSSDGTLRRVALNPRAQFGTKARRYLAAEILPEKLVPENMFTETGIQYRTIIANAGTRYSPSQKKGGALVGEMEVKLAEADIASELTARDYDALVAALSRGSSMEAMASVVRFVDTALNRPLLELAEKWRWDALVNAQIVLKGDNGYSDTVNYSDPDGHRFNALVWSDDTVDPYDDIFKAVQKLSDKGFEVSKIVTSRKVIGILAGNDKVKQRTSKITVLNGNVTHIPGRVTLAELNGINQAEGLPPFEIYDLQYRTQEGTGRFLPDTVMVFCATTGRDEQLDLGDTTNEILPDTLGYTGVGRPAGQGSTGRVIRLEAFDNKPPRIEGEAWTTMLPVIIEPEAVAVIKAIG